MADLSRLTRIAAMEFTDIVAATTIVCDKLRILLRDDSYIDFWWSKLSLAKSSWLHKETLVREFARERTE